MKIDEDIEKILSDLIKEYIDIFKELPKVGMGLETEYLLNYRISEINIDIHDKVSPIGPSFAINIWNKNQSLFYGISLYP